ncbi:hypothetical protein [Croceimicrobium sp.]|uniref:hypothetical protein n=1 Tax=Croceimicrobium sp. TaxID=2828340 RepID=UPI003BAB3755
MKETKDNQWLEYKTYVNSDVDQVKRLVNRELLKKAEERGRQDAEVGTPKKHGIAQVNFIRTTTQELINTIRGHHRADEHVENALAKQERILHEERIARDDSRNQLNSLQQEYKQMEGNFPKALAYIFTSLTVVAGLAEGALSLPAVRMVIPHFFAASFTSVFLGILLTILSHQLTRWWFLGRNKFQKVLIRTGITIGVLCFFSVMGVLRASYHAVQYLTVDQTGCGGILCSVDSTEVILFMFFSLAIFLPACLLAKLSPTKAQWLTLFRAKSKMSEIRKCQKKLDGHLYRISDAEDQMDELRQYAYSKQQYAIRIEEECITMAENAWEEYLQSNLRHRRDKVHPECFDKQFEPRLKTYFYRSSTTKSKTS